MWETGKAVATKRGHYSLSDLIHLKRFFFGEEPHFLTCVPSKMQFFIYIHKISEYAAPFAVRAAQRHFSIISASAKVAGSVNYSD